MSQSHPSNSLIEQPIGRSVKGHALPDDPESDQFARKLRVLNPRRQLLRTLVGTIVVILVVGAALYVALSPAPPFQPLTR